MSKVEFFVPGVPAPGGSKKGYYNKHTKFVTLTSACPRTKPWMETVKWWAKQAWNRQCLLERHIRFTFEFHMLRPKGHYGVGRNAGIVKASSPKFPGVRPDLTKLVRSTEDALTGIIWRNDSLVVKQDNSKIYVDKDPGVQILIEEIEDEPVSDSTEQKKLPFV